MSVMGVPSGDQYVYIVLDKLHHIAKGHRKSSSKNGVQLYCSGTRAAGKLVQDGTGTVLQKLASRIQNALQLSPLTLRVHSPLTNSVVFSAASYSTCNPYRLESLTDARCYKCITPCPLTDRVPLTSKVPPAREFPLSGQLAGNVGAGGEISKPRLAQIFRQNVVEISDHIALEPQRKNTAYLTQWSLCGLITLAKWQ